MINDNINKLKNLFKEIKDKELVESLRTGTTGIGYTFESEIGKKEDSSFLPDFDGIEIKTKLGYTKSPITLFCLTPKKDDEYCIKYILNTYGYPAKVSDLKNFRGNVYNISNNIIANKYIFKTVLDREAKKLRLVIKNTKFEVLNDNIYWDFEDLKKRLYTKLTYLALIKGYPYKKQGKSYYKYTSLTIYKLKNFEDFLSLIEQDKIYITFNIGTYLSGERYGQINDRGTAFRIQITNVNELFSIID